MSKDEELLAAVKSNNEKLVEKLLQDPNVNVNALFLSDEGSMMAGHISGSALHIAAFNNNPKIMNLLIDGKADLEIGTVNYFRAASPLSPLCLLVSAYETSRDEAASVLLRRGASLNIVPKGRSQKNLIDGLFYDTLANKLTNSFRKLFLHEALIRGEEHFVNEILSKGLSINVTEFMAQLGDRKIKNACLHQAERLINKLNSENKLNFETAQKMINILRSARDSSIDPNNYPKCLKSYLEKKLPDYVYNISLEKLTAIIEFSRGNILVPKTIEEIREVLSSGENLEYRNYLALFEQRPDLLDVKNFFEFIDPRNLSSSIVELNFRGEELISSLCEAAINKNLTEEQKSACITLLSRYENLSDIEHVTLSSAKTNFELSQGLAKGVEQLSAQTSENFSETNQKIDHLVEQNKLLFQFMESVNQQNQMLQKCIVTLTGENNALKNQLSECTRKLENVSEQNALILKKLQNNSSISRKRKFFELEQSDDQQKNNEKNFYGVG